MADPRKRPDARPMRLAYAVSAVAAVSASTAGLVHFGTAGSASTGVTPSVQAPGTPEPAPVRHVIHYVHLKPGQTAPPGARVITAKAPAPRIVVTQVPGAARRVPPPRVIVTHQSGHP